MSIIYLGLNSIHEVDAMQLFQCHFYFLLSSKTTKKIQSTYSLSYNIIFDKKNIVYLKKLPEETYNSMQFIKRSKLYRFRCLIKKMSCKKNEFLSLLLVF